MNNKLMFRHNGNNVSIANCVKREGFEISNDCIVFKIETMDLGLEVKFFKLVKKDESDLTNR